MRGRRIPEGNHGTARLRCSSRRRRVLGGHLGAAGDVSNRTRRTTQAHGKDWPLFGQVIQIIRIRRFVHQSRRIWLEEHQIQGPELQRDGNGRKITYIRLPCIKHGMGVLMLPSHDDALVVPLSRCVEEGE
jgi:hypothetical protein